MAPRAGWAVSEPVAGGVNSRGQLYGTHWSCKVCQKHERVVYVLRIPVPCSGGSCEDWSAQL